MVPAIPKLIALLQSAFEPVVERSIMTLCNITDDLPDISDEELLQENIAEILLKLLQKENEDIQKSADWLIANLLKSAEIYILTANDRVAEAASLKFIRKLLQCTQNSIVRAAAWTINYITDISSTQIQHVLEEDLFTDICKVLKSAELRSRRLAAKIFQNVMSSGTEDQMMHLIEDAGIMKALCELMASEYDADCILIILSCLNSLFKLADKKGFLEKSLEVSLFFKSFFFKHILIHKL